MTDLEERCLTRHAFHGDWNYALLAIPRPAPQPAPGPPPRPGTPGRCTRDQLSHPALTGISPAELDALAAALDAPSRALREQELHATRGRQRVNAAGPSALRRLDLKDHLIATLIREHLRPPVIVIASLLGADRSTVSNAILRTGKLLAATTPPATTPPPANPIKTLRELREYAASHGITLTGPPPAASTPPP